MAGKGTISGGNEPKSVGEEAGAGNEMNLAMTRKGTQLSKVKITQGTPVMVAAAGSPEEVHLGEDLELSRVDAIMLPTHVPVIFIYKSSAPTNGMASVTMESLKKSLATALTAYYPLAGRIMSAQEATGKKPATAEEKRNARHAFVIKCNNAGVPFTEGYSESTLAEAIPDPYRPDDFPLNLATQPPVSLKVKAATPLMTVQATRFACGSLVLFTTFDHMAADGQAFFSFMDCWSKVARGEPFVPPCHQRSLLKEAAKAAATGSSSTGSGHRGGARGVDEKRNGGASGSLSSKEGSDWSNYPAGERTLETGSYDCKMDAEKEKSVVGCGGFPDLRAESMDFGFDGSSRSESQAPNPSWFNCLKDLAAKMTGKSVGDSSFGNTTASTSAVHPGSGSTLDRHVSSSHRSPLGAPSGPLSTQSRAISASKTSAKPKVERRGYREGAKYFFKLACNAMKEGPIISQVFHVSDDALKMLKAQAMGGKGSGAREESARPRFLRGVDLDAVKFVSTDDVLTAHVWKSIMRARGLDQQPETPVSFVRVVNFRTRLDPPLPAEYFGNASMLDHARHLQTTAGEVTSTRLSVLARYLRHRVDLVGPARLRKFYEDELPVFPLVDNLPANVGRAVFVSSWANFNIYGCDFGGGAPSAVCMSYGSKPPFVSSVVILKPSHPQKGGLEIEVMLPPKVMQRLILDPTFLGTTSASYPLSETASAT